MNFFEYLQCDPERFQMDYVNTGLVDMQRHNEFPLNIYCYGRKAVHENIWDHVTSRCRGIIVNRETLEIVARPFEKFHNYGTDAVSERFEIIKATQPVVWEKLDGFLCTLYTWDGVDYIASKGSFHSIHAKWATAWYRKNVGESADWNGFTPVFEGLQPDLRIVVDYGKREELVLLSLINTETGVEVSPETLITIGAIKRLQTPKRIDVTWQKASVMTLAQNGLSTEEGYVLTWYPPLNIGPPFRLKMKYLDYTRLHRMVCGVSPKAIWEAMSQPHLRGELKDWLKASPEWFKKFVQKWHNALEQEYIRLQQKAGGIYGEARDKLQPLMFANMGEERKAYAAIFTAPDHKEFSGICFSLLDGKDTERVIWKQVKGMTKNGHPLRDMNT